MSSVTSGCWVLRGAAFLPALGVAFQREDYSFALEVPKHKHCRRGKTPCQSRKKKLVRRYFEDAPCNPDACDEIFAPAFQFHAIVHTGVTPQTVECTPESEKAFYEQHKSVWGGWQVTINEMIAEGDRVMVRWSSRGTHLGESHGLPPTGKQVTNSGINIFRIADGKIAEPNVLKLSMFLALTGRCESRVMSRENKLNARTVRTKQFDRVLIRPGGKK